MKDTTFMYIAIGIAIAIFVVSAVFIINLDVIEAFFFQTETDLYFFPFTTSWSHYVSVFCLTITLWLVAFFFIYLPIRSDKKQKYFPNYKRRPSPTMVMIVSTLCVLLMIVPLYDITSHITIQKEGVSKTSFGFWNDFYPWSEVKQVKLDYEIDRIKPNRARGTKGRLIFSPNYKIQWANGETIDLWNLPFARSEKNDAIAYTDAQIQQTQPSVPIDKRCLDIGAKSIIIKYHEDDTDLLEVAEKVFPKCD